MFSRNTILTIFTKFLILILNFILVLFTTRTWGSEGRGEIALIFTNISLIIILSNIFCGSSIAYYTNRFQREFLLGISISGAIVISIAGALVYSLIYGFKFFFVLVIISFLMSLTTSISSYWLGKNQMVRYNFFSFLSPLFVLCSLLIIYYLFSKGAIPVYYKAYYAGTLLALITGAVILFRERPFGKPVFSRDGLKSILGYGISNEFNYFIQFLNYRLPYYFIASILGLGTLGIFSIAISISEAVWIISNSMSTVLFSNVINSSDTARNRKETNLYARQSILISTFILAAGIIVPDSVYTMIFGEDFSGIRKFLLYLSPGIIAIAASNLYGHYFAGIGKLKILRYKSLLGLAVSFILLPFLVKKYELTGACIVLDLSYLVSSGYLWLAFHREKKSGHDQSSKG